MFLNLYTYLQVPSVSQTHMEAVCFCLCDMPLHRRMQIENLNKKLWPGAQNKLKKRQWMEELCWQWVWQSTAVEPSCCVMVGKAVAVTDWEGVTAAPLQFLESITQRRKNISHPSGLYGRWFNLIDLLKDTVQIVLEEGRKEFCVKNKGPACKNPSFHAACL